MIIKLAIDKLSLINVSRKLIILWKDNPFETLARLSNGVSDWTRYTIFHGWF